MNRPERSIVKQTLKLYIVHSVIHSSLTIDAKMIIENGEHLILTTFPTSQTFFVSSEMNLGTLLFIRLMITKSLAKFNMTTLTFSELKKCIYPNSDLKIRYFKFGQILKNSRTKSLSSTFNSKSRLCKEDCYRKKAASVGQNGRLLTSCNFFSF